MRNKMKKINIRPLSDLPSVGDTFTTSDSKYRGRVNSLDFWSDGSVEHWRIEIFDFESKGYRWTTLCVA